MKRSGLILLMMILVSLVYGQNERKVIRDGVRAYKDGEFEEAEVQFRRAESLNRESYEAEFNTGTALYAQEKYEETVKQYESLLDAAKEDEKTAQIWHNIGNSLLEAGQYAPSIEAYKNSLRKNPSDQETRYNLAYAMQKLKEQEEQKQEEQNQDQNKNQDQQEQDQNNDQDQGDQQQEQNQDQEKSQDQQEQDQDQDQEQQAKPQEISREDAERMLQAIQQQEKEVKEKVDKKKAAAAKVKTEKDW